MKKEILILLSACTFIATACSKKNAIAENQTPVSDVFYNDTLIYNQNSGLYTAEYFPNWQGDQWVYEVTDSLNNRQFRAEINVYADSSSYVADKIWQIKLPNEVDTFYVANNNGNINFTPKNSTSPIIFRHL